MKARNNEEARKLQKQTQEGNRWTEIQISEVDKEKARELKRQRQKNEARK